MSIGHALLDFYTKPRLMSVQPGIHVWAVPGDRRASPIDRAAESWGESAVTTNKSLDFVPADQYVRLPA